MNVWVPGFDFCERVLRPALPAQALAGLVPRVRARYTALNAARAPQANRVAALHLERQLLPLLALYQVLGETLADRGAALAAVERVCVAAFPRPGDWRIALLQRVPLPFALFKFALRQEFAGYPRPAWEWESVADSADCLAVHMRRCFYYDTLRDYGAPELAACYCATDDRGMALLPPGIRWERTTTLARGGAVCDYCWRRVRP